MKAAVVTTHDDNYKILADLTWERNRVLYAKKNGYGALAKTNGFQQPIIGWEKIAFLLEIMNNSDYDLLHFSGTDTLITNWHIPLTEFVYEGYSVTIATDFNGIQADSFVIKNDTNGRAWLQMIMDNQQKYSRHPYFEQGVMMETYHQYKDMVKVVPQRYLNAYHYPLYKDKGAKNSLDAMGFSGQWRKGDFLIHCPDHPMHIRLSLFNEILPEVIM
jgi:galactosyl transferase GMA12/MNN10 family